MTRSCEQCGKSFEAQRATRRYCSSTCRANKSLGAAPVAVVPADGEGAFTAATRRELVAADRVESALGQSALLLAARLDAGEGGSAAAALNREWRATRVDALAGASAGLSPVEQARDELARRRAARGA